MRRVIACWESILISERVFKMRENLSEQLSSADEGRSFTIRRRDGSEYIALVSAEDFDRVMAAGPWHLQMRNTETTAYVQRTVYSQGKNSTQYLHQFVLGTKMVDHRNGLGLDNRRSNLRPATRSQNGANRPTGSNSKFRITGVCWCKVTGKWRALIRVDGVQFNLGRFKDIEEAALAYEGAALLLHGQFARVRP